MQIYRPRSSRSREMALNKITTKNNSIPILNRFFTSTTTTRMNAQQVIVHDLNHNVATASSSLNGATIILNKAFVKVISFFKDFLEGLFRLVKRTDTVADVALYHIAVGHLVQPKLTKQEDVALWGEYLETGETDRMALVGRVAMSNPVIADVTTEVNDYATKFGIQSGCKDVLNNAEIARIEANPATDAIIKTMWNEVQVHFGEGTEEQKRTQGRQFGLVYVSKIKKTFNVIVVENLTSAPLDAALVELIDTGKEGTTGAAGTVAITSYVTDSATFAATHPLYLENEATVVVTESTTAYTITIRLTHV